jgi:hypothetical protein
VKLGARHRLPAPRENWLEWRAMEIVSTCVLRVASTVWQPASDRRALTIVCKATYLLAPGVSRLAPVQEEPIASDLYWDDDERGSLRSAGELVPFKRRAEVILVGHVFAPLGVPVRRLSPRLAIGEIDKTIDAFGDRSLGADGRASDPAPFVALPLRWERAAASPENPVGLRLDGPVDGHAVAFPNFLPRGFQLGGPNHAGPAAGFGPLSPAWPERARKLGVSDAGWDHRRWRELPFPPHFDGGFFNAAPDDQQLGLIRPDARLLLEHLHQDHPLLVTELEPRAPRARFETAGATQEVPLRCDTLTVDTSRGIAMLVWRGNVPLAHRDQAGRVVVSLEARAAPSADRARPMIAAMTQRDPPEPTLPLRPGTPGASALPSVVAELGPASQSGETEDVDLAMVLSGLSLPFRNPPPNPAAHPLAAAPAPLAPPREPPAPSQEPARAFPAPPPMIGPLATPEMLERREPAPPSEKAPPPPPAPEPTPEEPAAPPPPLAVFPLERCAAIAASIARRMEEKARILERHDLAGSTWNALEAHWQAAIRQETARGKQALLRSYDEAYVGQLEQERGPITVGEYAKLSAASERGTEHEVLAELDLPPAALLRLQRIWLKRTALTPALAQALRAALAAARDD